jgi:hypothetical protein
MAQRKHFGFMRVALGCLLALWLCLAPSVARAGTISFNQSLASTSNPAPTLNWSSGATWVGGSAPATNDVVVIALTGGGPVAAGVNFDVGSLSLSSLAISAPSQGYMQLILPA